MIPNKAVTFLAVCITAIYNYMSLAVKCGVSTYAEGVNSTINQIPFFLRKNVNSQKLWLQLDFSIKLAYTQQC